MLWKISYVKCELNVETDECMFDMPRALLFHGQVELYTHHCQCTLSLPPAAGPPLVDHDPALVMDEVYLRVTSPHDISLKVNLP